MSSGRRVYIIGFMGSGKSTAGKKLASSLGWHFVDLDKEIEAREGRSIAEIFAADGETCFRRIEAEALITLNIDSDTVISAGGGTPCYFKNMEFMLGSGLVVYLKMTPGQLTSRLEGVNEQRPLISKLAHNELYHSISDRLTEREKYYLMAPIIIEGIDLDIKILSGIVKTKFTE
jgi:shikimate kinase